MDLDASLKSLHTFKQKLEKLFDGGLLDRLEAAVASLDAAAGNPAIEELYKRVDEVAGHVTALEQRFDELDPRLAAIEKLADPAVLDLLDWLAGRREAIDVLLSLGETADGSEEAQGLQPGGPDAPQPTDPEPAQAPS